MEKDKNRTRVECKLGKVRVGKDRVGNKNRTRVECKSRMRDILSCLYLIRIVPEWNVNYGYGKEEKYVIE